MQPKIFVGIAVGVLAVIIGILGFSGSTFINDISEGGLLAPPSEANREVLPIQLELEDISVLEISERSATIEIKILVTNPNYKSVILQAINYQLYENDQRIYAGQIGERPEGMVAASNYFTLLSNNPTTIPTKITIKNTGNTPELWDALTNDSAKWRITGTAFFNLSSMTSGGENEIAFDFTK